MPILIHPKHSERSEETTILGIPRMPPDGFLSAELCENFSEDLLLEHLTGRHTSLLQAAVDFVHWHRQTQGLCTDDELLRDAQEEGFTEEEIAAVLLSEQYRTPLEESQERILLWADYAVAA